MFRDLREVRPTFIYSVPRFFETIHSLFNETVRNFGGNKEARKRAIELFRSDKGPLGDRCCSLSIGSAPVTPAIFQFMEDVWSEDNGGTAYVSRGYGSTECGTIAMNGQVFWTARVYLVEIIEEGLSFDGDEPRGEILIHTDKVVAKYQNGSDSGIVVDGTPFFRPGDACRTDSRSFVNPEWQGTFNEDWGDLNGRRGILLSTGDVLEVVGRTKNVVKLSNGEFVSPESIERKLDGVESGVESGVVVDQLLIVVDQRRGCVVALVVPEKLELVGDAQAEASLLRALRGAEGLQSHEKPVAVAIVGKRWSAEMGTMTSSNKLDRASIMRECRDHMIRIGVVRDGDEGIIGKKRVAEGEREKKAESKSQGNTTLLDRVCSFFQESDLSVASSFLPEIQHQNDFLEHLGLDSMQASLLCNMLELRGCAGFTVVLLMTKSLREIWSRVHERQGERGAAVIQRPASFWTAESQWDNNWCITRNQDQDDGSGGDDKGELRVLLTGVTGFIGPHLLDAVARCGRWTHIVALVRPPLDRVDLSLLPPHVRVDLVPSDIGRPSLGLSSLTWARLSQMNFDAVLHNAALVNHIRSYDQMKAHNVIACDDLVRLVSSSVVPPSFLFVSTVSAVGPGASEDLTSTPAEAVASLGGGYGKSKWVAERRLDGAARAGLLRQLCICRLGLIGPHRFDGKIANHRDWLHLFVQCCSLLKARPKMNDVSGSVVEVLPVDVTAKAMAALAVAGGECGGGEGGEGDETKVRIVALDARAAGMMPMNVKWLLGALEKVEGGEGGGWSRSLDLASWYKRAKEQGGQALVALSVMPRSRQEEDGIFALPDPSLDDLKRSDVVRRLLASIQLSGSDVLECYQKESFRASWAEGFADR